MAKLMIVQHVGPSARDSWEAWFGLDGTDPSSDAVGFCVGMGKTRNQAVAAAASELEAALEELQSPPGVIEERIA